MENSFSLVAEEMRHREQVQDTQAQMIATKASYLFSAATAVVGGVSAYLTLALEDIDLRFDWGLVALMAAGVSYIALVYCFAMAYWMRDFYRAPEPEELMKYLHLPPGTSIEDIADARRVSIEINDQKLEKQADWVNRELFLLIILIPCLAVTLIGF